MQYIFINDREILTPDFFTVYHTADGTKYNRIENEINHTLFTQHINVVKIELYKNGTKTSHPTLAEVIYKDDATTNTSATYTYMQQEVQ